MSLTIPRILWQSFLVNVTRMIVLATIIAYLGISIDALAPQISDRNLEDCRYLINGCENWTCNHVRCSSRMIGF